MFGGRSIQLARISGIRIGADASWFVVLFLVIFLLSGQYRSIFPGQSTKAFLLAAITAFAFFLSIALHELGHAFAARAVGMRVLGIDLWAFGGFTRMDGDSAQTPRAEFLISAAGPFVTALIVAATFLAGTAIVGFHAFWQSVAHGDPGASAAAAVLGYLAFINAAILILNLVPGLPLDGGRITRAVAWGRTGDIRSATLVTARIGRFAAYALGAVGIFLFARTGFGFGIWFLFVAYMIFSTSRAIEAQSNITARLGGITVGDVMDRQPVALPADTPLDRALDDYFVRYGWDWFPVVDRNGRFLGLASRDKVEAVPESLRSGWQISRVTATDTSSSFRVAVDQPLESLLSSHGLLTLGALMAVDGEGVLRGVVTVEQVKRALQPPSPVA